jgi:hypothetical protein
LLTNHSCYAVTNNTEGTYNMRVQPPPVASGFEDFVVDTNDPTSVTIVGGWIRQNGEGAFSNSYLIDGNRDKGKDLVRFDVHVPISGTYDVKMSFPANSKNANNVQVAIDHQSGKSDVMVNERVAAENGWLLLGTYKFKAGSAFITVSNKGTKGLVIVDAIKLSVSNRPLDDITTKGWSGCQSATTQYNSGDFSYTVLNPVLPSTSVTFSVRAKNDAHIGLVQGNKEQKNMIEIVLGGWGNTQSVLRTAHQGVNHVTVHTPDLISAHEYRSFYLTVDGATITVGKGTDVGAVDSILMQWSDPDSASIAYQVDHVAVGSGFGAGASWELCPTGGGNSGGDAVGGGGGLVCGSAEFIATVGGQKQCTALTKCDIGQEETIKPNANRDRVCQDCTVLSVLDNISQLPLLLRFTMLLALKPGSTCNRILCLSGVPSLTVGTVNCAAALQATATL